MTDTLRAQEKVKCEALGHDELSVTHNMPHVRMPFVSVKKAEMRVSATSFDDPPLSRKDPPYYTYLSYPGWET